MASTLMRPEPPPEPRWNTLQKLKAGRIVLIALDALLLIAAIEAVRVHRDAMKTVGKDSAPSIIAAQHIKSALADMDANAANELLGPPGGMREAVKAYESRREEAAKALIAAAENITYGELERAPIRTIQVEMGTYERLVQRSRDLHERGDAQTVTAYRDSAKLMDQTLLPAADALDQANKNVLERTYKEQSGKSSSATALEVMAGLVLIGTLVGVQFFLARKTRRTLNPFLLAGTLVALGFLQYSMHATSEERQQLKIAKADAFDSIHALWRARAVSYWANSDESRYLLDQEHADEHERDFIRKAELLADSPADPVLIHVAEAARSGIHMSSFSGYLADELNNITFAGEREIAVLTLSRFAEYLAVDKQIRQLERTGQHKEAITLCLGHQQGQSNWAFDRFDKALGGTLEINQKAFEEAVGNGLTALEGLEIKLAVAAAVIAVLVFLGLASRIREYE
jgi:hypothetical protein